MKKQKERNCRLGTVGGQAVLEGIMMKSGDRYSVAVRKEDGNIEITNAKFVSVRKKHKFLNIPILRGVVNFVEMMMLSYKTLSISANALGLEDEEPKKKKKEKAVSDNNTEANANTEKKEKDSGVLLNILMSIATVLGLALGLLLFFFCPTWATGLIESLLQKGGFSLGWSFVIIEGIFKVVIFVSYLLLVSLMKDIRRTFEYHGAEHKSIFCYESGEELTPENIKKFKRFHPRCGTSFLFVMILLGIIIATFLPKGMALRPLLKILLLPLTVGLGYEFIMFAGKHDNLFIRILSAPGLFMQRITTREPDEKQIEVAIAALKSSMPHVFPQEAESSEQTHSNTESNKDRKEETDSKENQ